MQAQSANQCNVLAVAAEKINDGGSCKSSGRLTQSCGLPLRGRAMKPPAIAVWTPRLRNAADHARNALKRVAVWTQRVSTPEVERAPRSEPANPIYLLGAITLGIPALLMIVLIGMNPAVQDGSFASILTFLVVSAFVVAAIFEIKRLADEPSDAEHP